jgi:hypothetical protein
VPPAKLSIRIEQSNPPALQTVPIPGFAASMRRNLVGFGAHLQPRKARKDK